MKKIFGTLILVLFVIGSLSFNLACKPKKDAAAGADKPKAGATNPAQENKKQVDKALDEG